MRDSPGALRVPGDPISEQIQVISGVVLGSFSGALRAPEMSGNTRKPKGFGALGLAKNVDSELFSVSFLESIWGAFGGSSRKVKKLSP